MKARITDLSTFTSYIVNNVSECKDKTDKSAYESACMFNDVITMGKTIVEPLNNKGVNNNVKL